MDEEQVYINRYIVYMQYQNFTEGENRKTMSKKAWGGSNEREKKLRNTVLEYKPQSLSKFLMMSAKG